MDLMRMAYFTIRAESVKRRRTGHATFVSANFDILGTIKFFDALLALEAIDIHDAVTSFVFSNFGLSVTRKRRPRIVLPNALALRCV